MGRAYSPFKSHQGGCYQYQTSSKQKRDSIKYANTKPKQKVKPEPSRTAGKRRRRSISAESSIKKYPGVLTRTQKKAHETRLLGSAVSGEDDDFESFLSSLTSDAEKEADSTGEVGEV